MEHQQDKSWTVYMQRTATSGPEIVRAGIDTKHEAMKVAMKMWTDDIFRVWTEYE